jgi:hypothetical protein
MLNRKRSGRTPGIHLQLGRRYQHAEPKRSIRSTRIRRLAHLLHHGLDAVHDRYHTDLDHEMMQALHDAVVRLLRPMVTATWTDEEARANALQVARSLLEEPLPDPQTARYRPPAS